MRPADALRVGVKMVSLAGLEAALAPLGLRLCGGVRPQAGEAHAARAGTLLVIGNAGAAMWQAFCRDVPPAVCDASANPLDDWIRRAVDAVAASLGARPIYPGDGPPFPPFQRWAMRAEPVHPSPLGILIHPVYGLWHAYRAALAVAEVLPLPPPSVSAHPCAACADKPCIAACPAAALGAGRYDVGRCVAHVRSAAGRACREEGCIARRACPVGRSHRYPADELAHHMGSFLRNCPAEG
ncbi:MAG: ferredoxin [Rhodospirillales bacterium]